MTSQKTVVINKMPILNPGESLAFGWSNYVRIAESNHKVYESYRYCLKYYIFIALH